MALLSAQAVSACLRTDVIAFSFSSSSSSRLFFFSLPPSPGRFHFPELLPRLSQKKKKKFYHSKPGHHRWKLFVQFFDFSKILFGDSHAKHSRLSSFSIATVVFLACNLRCSLKQLLLFALVLPNSLNPTSNSLIPSHQLAPLDQFGDAPRPEAFVLLRPLRPPLISISLIRPRALFWAAAGDKVL